MAKIHIPYSALYQWYVKEKLTAEEIGQRMNCSEQTIRRRLEEYGIPIRERGPQPVSRVFGGRLSRKWSPDLAYVVGLIAADGNLSPDERHITFVSQDLQLHETYKQCLGISNKTGPHGSAFHTTFGDVVFYNWLLKIGLMPKKTFKMRKIKVSDRYFADFVRGSTWMGTATSTSTRTITMPASTRTKSTFIGGCTSDYTAPTSLFSSGCRAR